MPQTTFRAVQNGPQVDSCSFGRRFRPSLKRAKPAGGGNFRLLKNEAAAPVVAGLEPGEYLVDDSGKVVQRVERNFPATLRADMTNLGPPEKRQGRTCRS